MASFKTHLTGGIVVGVAAATSAFSFGSPSILQFITLSSLGTMGGILPDLDSDTGRPIKLLFGLVSTLLVLVTISSLLSNGSTFTMIIVSVGLVYCTSLSVFFVGKKLTVHRGVMHSIPFAFFVGIAAAIASSSLLGEASLLAGITSFLGVLSHLLLDELNSLGVHYGFVPYVKKSFGTAMKFTGLSFFSTVAIYGLLIVLACTYMIVI